MMIAQAKNTSTLLTTEILERNGFGKAMQKNELHPYYWSMFVHEGDRTKAFVRVEERQNGFRVEADNIEEDISASMTCRCVFQLQQVLSFCNIDKELL